MCSCIQFSCPIEMTFSSSWSFYIHTCSFFSYFTIKQQIDKITKNSNFQHTLSRAFYSITFLNFKSFTTLDQQNINQHHWKKGVFLGWDYQPHILVVGPLQYTLKHFINTSISFSLPQGFHNRCIQQPLSLALVLNTMTQAVVNCI